MPAVATCEDLEVVYATKEGPVHALGPVDLSIEKGEFVSVVGPSGCGKSTLLKVIGNLLRPSGGRVHGLGRERTGIVFQEPVLLDWRNVIENVLLQADARGWRRADFEERANELLAQVGLEGFGKRRPYELSGGMQQRVSICRALLHDPTLVLMDEPFGALDALSREQMAEDLRALWEARDLTVFFVTHSIAEAVLLSSRVLVLSSRPGRIVADVPIELEGRSFAELESNSLFGHYTSTIRQHLEAGQPAPGARTDSRI